MNDHQFCINCGAGLNPGAKFCPSCGVQTGQQAASATMPGSRSPYYVGSGIAAALLICVTAYFLLANDSKESAGADPDRDGKITYVEAARELEKLNERWPAPGSWAFDLSWSDEDGKTTPSA